VSTGFSLLLAVIGTRLKPQVLHIGLYSSVLSEDFEISQQISGADQGVSLSFLSKTVSARPAESFESASWFGPSGN